MINLTEKYQDKYYSLLRRLQQCSLGNFIFLINSLGKLGNMLVVITLSTNKKV